MQNLLSAELPEELRLEGSKFYGRSYFLRGHWTYATDRFVDSFRKKASDANPETAQELRTVLQDRIARFALDLESARYVDKSQSYTLKVSFLAELLVGCHPKFVLVVRNPYIMCRKSTRKPSLSQLDMCDRKRLKLAAQHYDNSIQAALEDAPEVESFYILRFEDFLASPYLEIEALCEFLDIEFQARMLPSEDDPPSGKWYPIRYEVNESELEKMTKEEKAIIDERCRDWANRFCYDDEPSSRGEPRGGPLESWGI